MRRLTKDKMKYTAVIKYNGQYYVSHKLGSNKKFRFMPYETSHDDDFTNEDLNDIEIDNDNYTLDLSELEDLLEKAIEDEDYIKASKLRDIINERKGLK